MSHTAYLYRRKWKSLAQNQSPLAIILFAQSGPGPAENQYNQVLKKRPKIDIPVRISYYDLMISSIVDDASSRENCM